MRTAARGICAVTIAAAASLGAVSPAAAVGSSATTTTAPAAKAKTPVAGRFCKKTQVGRTAVAKNGSTLVCRADTKSKKKKHRYRWRKA